MRLVLSLNKWTYGYFLSSVPDGEYLVRIQISCLIILKLRVIEVLLKHNFCLFFTNLVILQVKFDLIKLQRLSQEIESGWFRPVRYREAQIFQWPPRFSRFCLLLAISAIHFCFSVDMWSINVWMPVDFADGNRVVASRTQIVLVCGWQLVACQFCMR